MSSRSSFSSNIHNYVGGGDDDDIGGGRGGGGGGGCRHRCRSDGESIYSLSRIMPFAA